MLGHDGVPVYVRVFDDQIAPGRDELAIRTQLPAHVRGMVVGVEDDQNTLRSGGSAPDLVENVG